MASAADYARAAKSMDDYTDADIMEMVTYLDDIANGNTLNPDDMQRMITILVKSVNSMRRRGHDKSQKRISESKCIMFLKTYNGDKNEFQEWLDKLINQFAVTYPKTGYIFK